MTQAQWNIVEDKLRTLGSGVHLEIDGYHVSFYVVQYKMKLVIATYVDGYIKGEWIINDCEIRQKFYQCSKRSLLSRKGKEKLKREKKAATYRSCPCRRKSISFYGKTNVGSCTPNG